MSKTISVTYKAEEISELMDSDIIQAMDWMGYKWYAQGYDLRKRVRDLAFKDVDEE